MLFRQVEAPAWNGTIRAAAGFERPPVPFPDDLLRHRLSTGLAQAVTYIASAPKSNAAYLAVDAALENVRNYKTTVPAHLQDSHYKGAAKLGHGIGYKYAHDYPEHYVEQQYLPDEIKDAKFYFPTEIGYEKNMKERLDRLKSSRQGS